jgi:hypothetical protein
MTTRFGLTARDCSPDRSSSLRSIEVRARVRVSLADGGGLYFCQHHASEHQAALEQVARSLEKLPQ